MDLHDIGVRRHGRHHPAGAVAVRLARTDRRADVGDRRHHRQAAHQSAAIISMQGANIILFLVMLVAATPRDNHNDDDDTATARDRRTGYHRKYMRASLRESVRVFCACVHQTRV